MTLLPRNKELSEVQSEQTGGNQLFPVFLKLNQLHVVLIGAGPVGLEKLTAVLHNSPDATVTVIAETFIPEIHQLTSDYPNVGIKQKTFTDTDLDGGDIVIAATANNELNQYIRQSAHERKLLVNVADKPDLCDFYLGSIVQKGDLKIAISTNGKSPTIAKRLKEVLNESLPAELDTTLTQMSALRETLNGDFAYKVKRLNEVTSMLVEPAQRRKNFKWLIWGTIVISIVITVTALWFNEPGFKDYAQNIDPIFYKFLAAGFAFALIDGAIGMSYGVTSTTFSLSMGVTPASASMGVHISEIMSCGIAGWMHYRMGNINWKLFWLLVVPGVIGAIAGATILSSLEHYSKYSKPFVSLYTLILGIVIFRKALSLKKKIKQGPKIKKIRLLGLSGGFIDAVGGGGWGSIVLSSLIAGGRNPRFSLGTVKLSRFFVALAGSIAFITLLHSARWASVAGLVIGAALASPIAARISNRISTKVIMFAVSVIVILISLKSIWAFVGKLLHIA